VKYIWRAFKELMKNMEQEMYKDLFKIGFNEKDLG
jgi:hypothetical protein